MLFRRHESSGARERTERGWGPFTGRQLATIVVALIVALLLPTTAYAFTVGHTAVTDAVTKATANVDATGALHTSEAGPASFFDEVTGVSGGPSLIATPPAGMALIITSLHLNVFTRTAAGSQDFFVAPNSSCSPALVVVDEVDPATTGETVLPYVPGYALPAGDFLCAFTGSTLGDVVTTIGYTVPASTVPAPQARTGAPLRLAGRP